MEELLAEKFPYFLPLLDKIQNVRERYEQKKKATNSMDFDDLLQKSLSMFQQHERIAEIYRRQFQFILVDEYQDTNKIQADLVDLLARDHHNVMVVGDDAQSIYSWRGANFQNILEFPKRYPAAQLFKIEMKYRSVPEILEVANAAIAAHVRQFRKHLSATRESKALKPALVALNDGVEQAQFVAHRVLELRAERVDVGHVAEVTSAPTGVSDPGYSFGERLRALTVPAKSRKSWEQLVHTLDEIAPAGQPNMPSEMITSVVEAIYDDYAKANFTNYELRREDLNQLAIFARQFKDVHEFLSQLALISNVDAEAAATQGGDKESVNLSSVHQAKGLEFHTVFVIWLTDGMFPSNRSLDTREALEEERRLFYVAITRARDELYLAYPQMRLSGGYGDVFQRPSRFLQEIPNDLVEDWQVTRK